MFVSLDLHALMQDDWPPIKQATLPTHQCRADKSLMDMDLQEFEQLIKQSQL